MSPQLNRFPLRYLALSANIHRAGPSLIRSIPLSGARKPPVRAWRSGARRPRALKLDPAFFRIRSLLDRDHLALHLGNRLTSVTSPSPSDYSAALSVGIAGRAETATRCLRRLEKNGSALTKRAPTCCCTGFSLFVERRQFSAFILEDSPHKNAFKYWRLPTGWLEVRPPFAPLPAHIRIPRRICSAYA
jgi:hypothetical protein